MTSENGEGTSWMDCSSDQAFEERLKEIPSDIVLHSILCHYILDLDRYAFLYKKYKSDLILLFMGRYHGEIHLIFKNVSISTFRAIGRDGLVFNFMKSEILDQVLPSRIHSIDFISNYFTRQDSLSELPPIIINHIGYIRKLNLRRQASFKAFDQLELFTNLEEFRISDTYLPVENLIRILSTNKHLKSIEYSNPVVADDSVVDVPLFLTSIVSLPALRQVNLSGVKFISNEIVAKLFINLPYMSELLVRYCPNITDIAFIDIEKHNAIKFVDISGCKITKPSTILKNHNIRKLCYEDSDFENVEFELTCPSKVMELSFSISTNISPSVLRNIADFCTDVEVLRLETTTYKSECLPQFLKSSINKLTKLKELYLNGTKLQDGNIKEISLENLQVLSLEFNDITDSSIEKIKQFPQLRDISLGRTLVTQKGIADLLEFYHNNGKVIENLALNTLKLTGEQILSIPYWTQVQRLNLSKNKVNNDAFLFLIKHSNIIELNLQDNLISNEALHPHIYSNKSLTKLNLSSNRNISTRTKSSIVMKCPTITDLTL